VKLLGLMIEKYNLIGFQTVMIKRIFPMRLSQLLALKLNNYTKEILFGNIPD